MLLSHIAVGFVGKKVAPSTSLGTLVIAALFADFVWIALTFLGVEHFRIVPGITLVSPYDMYDTPISHGLLANIGIATLFGAVYFLIKKDRKSAIAVGCIVVSHWFLDVIAHRPDMVLLTRSGLHVGLELWRSYPATLIIEIGFFIAGLAAYISATKARRTSAFLPLVLLVLYSALQFYASLVVTPMDAITLGLFLASAGMFLIWYVLANWTDAMRDAR